MALITDRIAALNIVERFIKRGVPMAVFGTASFWNTEAILLCAQNFAKKHCINDIAVVPSVTFNYRHMPQCPRFTYSQDPRTGLISNMQYLNTLCGEVGSPYYDVTVLPHLDHADPVRDKWALTDGVGYFASVMFDAQAYNEKENITLTSDYVKTYGKSVLIEGIIDELNVSGGRECLIGENDNDEKYISKVVDYIKKTGVDYIVADLGTEQQSTTPGKAKYMKDRARILSSKSDSIRLVLHGTSSLTDEQMMGLGDDGISRINMWTKIARDTGKYAAENAAQRIFMMHEGDFEASDSRKYLYDSIEYASKAMEGILDKIGYSKL